MKPPCHAPGCDLKATHGKSPYALDGANYEATFCHTHWFMLPPGYRVHITSGTADGILRAQQWHEDQEEQAK